MALTLSNVLLDSAYKRLRQTYSPYGPNRLALFSPHSLTLSNVTDVYLSKRYLFNAEVVAAYQCILALDCEKMSQSRDNLDHLSFRLRQISTATSNGYGHQLFEVLLRYFIKHAEHWKQHADKHVFSDIATAVYRSAKDPCLCQFIAKHVSQIQALFANLTFDGHEIGNSLVALISGLPMCNHFRDTYFAHLHVSSTTEQSINEYLGFLALFDRFDVIDDFDKESRRWMKKEQYLGLSDAEELMHFVSWRFHIKRYTGAASRIQCVWRRHRVRKLKQWIARVCHTRGLTPSIGYLMFHHASGLNACAEVCQERKLFFGQNMISTRTGVESVRFLFGIPVISRCTL